MQQDTATRLVRSLFLSWYSPLVRYAFRFTGSLTVAEDLVQESFLALYKALIEQKEIHNPKAWTLCVVRREIGRWIRDPRRNGGQLDTSTDLDSLTDPKSPHENSILARDELDQLLSVLTRREQEVVLLRAQACRYKEIGSQLGISLNSVKTLLARALRKIQTVTESAQRHPVSDHDGRDASRTLH
jgi:RNA polymerase sigma factor (sigma-70 family)